MNHAPKTLGVLLLSGLMAAATLGCKEPEIKQDGRKGRTVKATVATFDPSADVVLDLDKYGAERPDDYEAQMAFHQAFEPMDACVLAAKERKGMPSDQVLGGDMDIAVKLEPKTGKALGVNATLPGKLDKDAPLKDCIREAVATVHFPKYDGPPVVVEFHTEVDAGTMED
ncbi:MAG: hypothetical protein KDK70_23460 [Myxococcales bacterium]|nr:hypothetical protein [Myxococcales bacterium]